MPSMYKCGQSELPDTSDGGLATSLSRTAMPCHGPDLAFLAKRRNPLALLFATVRLGLWDAPAGLSAERPCDASSISHFLRAIFISTGRSSTHFNCSSVHSSVPVVGAKTAAVMSMATHSALSRLSLGCACPIAL